MEYLLYSSEEMFSSTQLVRQSKKIFDKLTNDEIKKAVILRDGKPNFMLLDFKKYENVMSEFKMLKEFFDEHNKNENVNLPEVLVEKAIEDDEEITFVLNNDNSDTNIIIEEDDEDIDLEALKEKEDLELREALRQLDDLNLDDELKDEAKKKLIDKKNSGEIKEFWN